MVTRTAPGAATHCPMTDRSSTQALAAIAQSREDDALRWLLSFADMERGVGWNPLSAPGEQWKLARTRRLLDLGGSPDRSLACVLIAGTKGKGSTAAFLASVLHAAGVRAGLYTQPHLQRYRERIRVDGAAIAPDDFADAVAAVRTNVERLRGLHPDAGEPTTFEITTALALGHFAQAGCAVAVVEVGLGGRLDATNALEPLLSVITPTSRDHTDVLGRTLAAIATEKAGIMRPGRLALLAPQRPAATRALHRRCRLVGARCVTVEPLAVGTWLSLAGDHQRTNAALAVAAARALPGVVVDERAINAGLGRVRWPGRFEVIDGRPTIVLDGAHNGASAQAFARTLREHAAGRPIHFVVGMHGDKEIAATLRPLLAIASSVTATRARSPRAVAAEQLAARCRRAGAAAPRMAASVDEALTIACALAGRDGIVAVTGSLALVGEARDALGLDAVLELWPRETDLPSDR